MSNANHPSAPGKEAWLIGRASEGDLEAFNQLVLRYQDLAYHHAYAILGDPARAEDAAQEGFIHAFQAIDRFRGGSFRGWLLKIVTNAAYDTLRRAHRHPTQPLFPADEDGEELDSAPWLADPAASVEKTLERAEEAKRLYSVIADLAEPYRTVLQLIDIEELDYAEAARVLQIPVGTVKSRLARARLRVAKALRGQPETPGMTGPAATRTYA